MSIGVGLTASVFLLLRRLVRRFAWWRILTGAALALAFVFLWCAAAETKVGPFSHAQWRLLGCVAMLAAGGLAWRARWK
ncbi:MAG: hypothetical protein NT151_09880 [Acidobacteria bacterium]|nr:hypothetical protein [Acidobacteriota bacterium]